ncbi:MAG: Crp/Fnr family transcriptional regulator [Acidobacteriota bacterium]|nr:Crp/Fnr family transcriptional regulator [Acidobacteriota bacterium]
MAAEPTNLFLSSLSLPARESLLAASTAVSMPIRTSLNEAEQPPAFAFFLTSGIASVVTSMPDGGSAEVGLIGPEGVACSLHLLGPSMVSTRCFIQIEATALRIPFPKLQKAFRASEEIRVRLLEFVQAQAVSLGQLAGCHRLHEAEQRLSRWLLEAHDRVQSDELTLTQEFLAMMLGSRRTTVTAVAGSLQRSGLIEHSRGRVKILDRKKLEATACPCYKVTQHLLTNLYRQEAPMAR